VPQSGSVAIRPRAEAPAGFVNRLAAVTKTGRWVPLVPALVTFLVMLWGITGPSYWRDESATVSATARPLPGLIRMLGHVDAVHGLYYLTMWVVTRVAGTSALAFRLPSALGMALAAAGIAALGWRLRSWQVGLLAGLLIPCNPVLSVWGQNARPFALEIAAAVFASYRLLDAIARPGRRQLAFYGASLALLGYLNLFGLLLVPAHAITVAATSRPGARGTTFRGWLIAAAAGCVAVTPVVVWGWRERGQIAWIQRPGIADAQILVTALGGGVALSVAIIAALAALGSVCTDWPAQRRADDSLTWLCLPWLAVPPLTLLIVSRETHMHVYDISYVLFCIPPVALLAGAGLASLRARWRVLVLGLIVFLVSPAQLAARQPDGHGDDIRGAASFLQQHARSGQAVIYWSGSTWEVPDWALAYSYGFTKLTDIGELAPPAAVNNLFGSTVSRTVLQRRMGQVSQLWVIELGHDYPSPSVISARSFRLAGTWQISDIWLRLYDRTGPAASPRG
jgi:mannosyltransferase